MKRAGGLACQAPGTRGILGVREGRVMLKIQIYCHGEQQGEVTLQAEDFPALIGRDEAATVRIDDRAVSRRHAQLTLAEHRVVITDLGSGNGTYFGERPVESKVIEHRDEATIGMNKLRFELEGKLRPTRPASPYDTVKDDEGGLTMKVARTKLREVVTRQAAERPAILVQVGLDRRVPLKAQVCFIGSSNLCDVIVRGWRVARKHALILKEGGGYRLYDLTGRKRVVVGEERVDTIKLTGGLSFSLGGKHQFRFEEGKVAEQLTAGYEDWFTE
jgi:pSer/pThr/pTyr-binding forkhead associated (FHA) protein